MNILKRLTYFFFAFLLMATTSGCHRDFVWYQESAPITFLSPASIDPVVQIALDMFCDDLYQVTGTRPECVDTTDRLATIRFVQLDRYSGDSDSLKSRVTMLDSLMDRKDAFIITLSKDLKTSKRQIWVVGSDKRGIAYGILEMSRLAGVSPWIWWGDVKPEPQTELTLPAGYTSIQYPSVEYRGIFLNDEDWSLRHWSWKNFEPSIVENRIGPKTYKEIFKLLLRLRANMIWPGMHTGTVPFYTVPGNKEMADSCAIVIGTSHCEPLMRNNVGEWKDAEWGAYDYVNNRENVLQYWKERVKEVRKYENIYTVGMRGVHDQSMEGAATLQEKTDLLEEVIAAQREILRQYVHPFPEKVPQAFVPYKEVLEIMDNGMDIPEDITLMWCDDNYGYLTRLGDQSQQQRSGGAGIYYHTSYWGRPHDYLWLSTTQPGLIYYEMKQAYDHQARRIWITNVHDMKTAAYDMELFLDMAWNIHSVTPETLVDHQQQWLCHLFGEAAGQKLLPAMLDFYRLCTIRKPEFMGWNQVEVGGDGTPAGWSQVQDTEFSLTAFGDELDRYLQSYTAIKQVLAEAESLVASERQDAFFAQIKYPVYSASAMAVKMLEAQRARAIASTIADSTLWSQDKALMDACVKSMSAYAEIKQLTATYNQLANGKWNETMNDAPRDLYVFQPAALPVQPSEQAVKAYAMETTAIDSSLLVDIPLDRSITFNAQDYSRASQGAYVIPLLGHSSAAVSLPKGDTLTYTFQSEFEGTAQLRTAVIPTQPTDTGDIRIGVSIDGEPFQICSFKEPFRSEVWKQNVLRGQAVLKTAHTLQTGTHTLRIVALDAHIVVDQWMLDFNPERPFYVFPVVASNGYIQSLRPISE